MRRIAALTFDDGTIWQRPLIESLGIPVTCFIPTGWVGINHQMTWDDIVSLHTAGHEIGCHGHDHSNWGHPGFDADADIKTSLDLFEAHGIYPSSFAPPRNTWIESPQIRKLFRYGRKGRGDFILDQMRMIATGLTKIELADIPGALRFNADHGWSVYIVHLYTNSLVRNKEEAVAREFVRQALDAGIEFTTFNRAAQMFIGQLDALLHCCPLCGSTNFAAFRDREAAKCATCGSLERHRSLARYLQDEHLKGPGCAVLVSSAELVPVFEAAGFSVNRVSQHLQPPWNDVQDMGAIATGTVDYILLQHVLPQVQDDRAAMREIARVIKPISGRALIEHPLFDGHNRPGEGLLFRRYGKSDWEALVSEFFCIESKIALLPNGILYVLRRMDQP